jgi:hypothetical protein
MMMNATHPLIPNANEYMYEKKYISIHSHDINLIKYPNISDFEIELPQDYCNVQSMGLSSFIFPSNVNTFTKIHGNITLTFIIDKPYRPDASDPNYTIDYAIFTALYTKLISTEPNFVFSIAEGIYNNDNIAVELTNKFNYAISKYIIDYFTAEGDSINLQTFTVNGKYTEFKVENNSVSQKLWFGNKSSGFILTTLSDINRKINSHIPCSPAVGVIAPNFHYWGLSTFLGLPNININSIETVDLEPTRFYYLSGTLGYWLTPSKGPTTPVYYVEALTKFSVFVGRYYMYMEISGYNNMDETQLFNVSDFNTQTNGTNGIVNSAFAKIPLYTNPNFPADNPYYNGETIDNVIRIFNPPMSKIRRLRIRFRWHDGNYIDFSGSTYAFTLVMNILNPQNSKKYTMYRPESLG